MRRSHRELCTIRLGLCLALLSVVPAVSAQSGVVAPGSGPVDHGMSLPGGDTSPVKQGIELPDSPAPASESSSVAEATAPDSFSAYLAEGADPGFGVTPAAPGRVPLRACPYDTTHARECREHWGRLLMTASAFNAFQNGGNLYTGYWYRYETGRGKWLQRWINSDTGWAWGRWDDGNPPLDVYVGHPMMGSITSYMWIQNDPKGSTVDFGSNRAYWHSRLRALAFSTAYSFEWKFGPFGEAGVGHIGDHGTHHLNKVWVNDTGDSELVTTPVGGFLWTLAEDYLDKAVVKPFEAKPRGPIALTVISFLTPSRATANIFRFRAPWYRDGRRIPVSSFFAGQPGPEDEAAESGAPEAPAQGSASVGVTGAVKSVPAFQPEWPRYGGVHEVGAWWGVSPFVGHIWGYASDVVYMPVDVNYSYLINPGRSWQFRYSPEMTAIALLDEPLPGAKDVFNKRLRSYGSGVSPVGLRVSFHPDSRVQPFLATNGGFIYFDNRVLSRQGSQYMYTIDFGGGLIVFRSKRQSFTFGYRYQHLSNANISHHNPGVDTNLFYFGVSRWRSKGYR